MITAAILLTMLQSATMQSPDSVVIADFTDMRAHEWFAVNDGVMGGVSQSRLDISNNGTGVFSGDLSLENNGGFASVRTEIRGTELAPFNGLTLRVRGDGRRYEVRLRTGGRYRSLAYKAEFETQAGTWTTVELPFSVFQPTLRGYVPPNAPPLDVSSARELGLLLADGRPGSFRLEVERIIAVGHAQPDPQ